jgi:hypothetical protein
MGTTRVQRAIRHCHRVLAMVRHPRNTSPSHTHAYAHTSAYIHTNILTHRCTAQGCPLVPHLGVVEAVVNTRQGPVRLPVPRVQGPVVVGLPHHVPHLHDQHTSSRLSRLKRMANDTSLVWERKGERRWGRHAPTELNAT